MHRFFPVLVLLLSLPSWAQIRPVAKSPAASQMVKASYGDVVLWIDPTKWKHRLVRRGLQTLESPLVPIVQMITDAAPLSTLDVKKAFLAELRKKDPNARAVDSEARTVSGGEILFSEFTYQEVDRPMVVICGFYGGPSGSLRILYAEPRHIPNASRREFNQLLAGLEIKGNPQ